MAGASPHLVHLLDTFALGDAQLRTARVISGLGERYRHTIVTLDRRTGARRLIPGALDVGVVGPPGRRGFGLARLLRLLRPDLVLVSSHAGLPALLAAVRHGVPLLLQIDEASREGRFRLLLSAILLLRRVALVAIASDKALPLLRAALDRLGIPVADVPAGVTVVQRPASVPVPEEYPDAVAVGMMMPPRHAPGLRAILHAFREAPHRRAARMILFGNGPDGPALVREADRLSIAAQVVVVDDAVDPAALVRKCDIFALVEDGGIGPLVALEAMAAGLPLVGITGPQLHEVVAAGNRDFLLPPGRGPALTAKMDDLLRSGDLRQSLGRGNLARAREHPLGSMVARYDELFRRLLDPRPQRREHGDRAH